MIHSSMAAPNTGLTGPGGVDGVAALDLAAAAVMGTVATTDVIEARRSLE